jgi:tetratricopeptide (TPR) repeat protein
MSYEIGKKLIKQKQYKKAFSIFSKLLEKNSRDLRANFQMGKIYYELNSLNKSLFFLKNVTKYNQIHPI